MFTVDELAKQVDEYQRRRISLEDFENWFEDHSTGAYAHTEMKGPCAAIDAAFAQYHFDHIGEQAFRDVLANLLVDSGLRSEK